MPNYTRQQVQAMLIIDHFRQRKAHVKSRCEIDTAPHPMRATAASTADAIVWPVDYMYDAGHILVRDDYLERVRGVVRALGGKRVATPATPVIRGLHRVALPAQVAVHDVVNAVRHGSHAVNPKAAHTEGLGPSVGAPDHLISLTAPRHNPSGAGGTCPACEPSVVEIGSPPVPAPAADPSAGAGVRIVVLDTGIDPIAVQTHRWLSGVTGELDPAIRDRAPLGTYAGHGTFIAGIIRTVAPAAEVHVRADFKAGGVIRESELVRALHDVLAHDDPDIISLSAGVWSGESSGPLGFQVFYESHLHHHKGVAMVTSAGNDGSRRPFWPAAAPWTVSVGALRPDWGARAEFSNFGGWVDVYAPGEDIVNAFPTGVYRYTEPPNIGTQAEFTGMARWSGTSFSAPMVAGLIAARMSTTGENGVAAATALLSGSRTSALAGAGSVLLPGAEPVALQRIFDARSRS